MKIIAEAVSFKTFSVDLATHRGVTGAVHALLADRGAKASDYDC